jgi:hypothetical protein
MKIRPPRPATLATVCIEKVIALPNGKDDTTRYGTGFFYRGPAQTVWLVTNWHVLTGRRPDSPGETIGLAGQSPYAINVTFPLKKRGHFSPPLTCELYKVGVPIWRQYKLELGFDLAAIPIDLPEEAAGIAIQDFASNSLDAIEPGIDLITVGFPFKHSSDVPYPLWKRGMLASEPGYTLFGNPQMFIDIPGSPGMSGSPVFRPKDAALLDAAAARVVKDYEAGKIGAVDMLASLDPQQVQDRTVGLDFVGVYAGATDDKSLDRLQLGRMYPASVVELLVTKGEQGTNPFPPISYQP